METSDHGADATPYGISDGGPGAGDGGHPAADVAARQPRRRAALDASAPRVVAWEVTRSCNLACAHCRASALHGPYEGELSTTECLELVGRIAATGKPILILTGGEPLLRPDIFAIAEAARDAGLRPVMAPNGTLVTAAAAARMKAAGIGRISISIDFPDPVEHDRFRGCPGAFDSALRGIRSAQDAGIEIQINSTITQLNVGYLPRLLALAEELGAVSFHPFMLVPTGRGKDLAEQELDPDDYERTLNWIYDAQRSSPLFFKPTDVPHYWRVMRQRARAEGAARGPPPLSRRPQHAEPRLPGGRRLLLRLAHRLRAALRLLRQDGRQRPRTGLRRHLAHVAALCRPARPRGAQGQVRRLRVQAGLRRLPGARLRAHRRLPGRGALLRLRAAGLGAGERLTRFAAAGGRVRPV